MIQLYTGTPGSGKSLHVAHEIREDLLNFFPEQHLKSMQISDFARWHKEGDFAFDDIFCDYFTLGRRKSNNIFLRVYNKSKEVIELGYKQFFVNIWYDCGLISQYDKFLLEKAFIYGKYDAIQKARCAWYMCYGENPAIKLDILHLNENPDTPSISYKKLADKIVPDLTVVCNIEFQTKRKYYDRLDIPLITTETGAKQSIYNIFECYQTILDKLTCGGEYERNGCIRFIKYKGDWAEIPRLKRPVASWWQLLQNCKPYELGVDLNFEILRKYQVSLDIERRKNCALSGIASNIAYYKKSNVTSNFIEIGFRLWECEHYYYYKELGFDSVCDYALSELGFKKSSTRNFIRVYERFCSHDIVKKAANDTSNARLQSNIQGNYMLLHEYKNFTYSQLTELLSLSDSQIDAIAPTPADTVKKLRDKKQDLYEEAEAWLREAILQAVGGKLGFKKQIYEHYEENKSVSKLASFIKKHMLEIDSGGVFFDNGSYCRFNGTRVTFFHSLYYPQDKVMRWFDVAEKIVGYINEDTFLSEQVHIDEIAEELADEMTETLPKSETERADEQRPYKILLYKDDIDIVLESLRAADIPQDTYDRIYEIIGKAEIL